MPSLSRLERAAPAALAVCTGVSEHGSSDSNTEQQLIFPQPQPQPDLLGLHQLRASTAGGTLRALIAWILCGPGGDSLRSVIQDLGYAFQQLRRAGSVESVAAYDEWNLTTTEQGVPDDVTAIYFTGNASSHFGVPALLGRGLIESDAPEDQDPQPVVVLGYQFWQSYYGGDRSVLGRKLNSPTSRTRS